MALSSFGLILPMTPHCSKAWKEEEREFATEWPVRKMSM